MNLDKYERPSVAVDAVVFGVSSEKNPENFRALDNKNLKILLVQRKEAPFENNYALPGGFLRPQENVNEATRRELQEEAGVEISKIIPLNTYSNADRDPRGWIISIASIALTKTMELASDSESDAKNAEWINFEYFKNSNKEIIILKSESEDIRMEYINGTYVNEGECKIAFDHAQIIYDAYKKLQDEVRYHDIIFDLLPEMFTISDLQIPYEIILDEKEAPANFRRKMASKIVETEFVSKATSHRSSKFYKKNIGTIERRKI